VTGVQTCALPILAERRGNIAVWIYFDIFPDFFVEHRTTNLGHTRHWTVIHVIHDHATVCTEIVLQ
jgi:hypothetical protein